MVDRAVSLQPHNSKEPLRRLRKVTGSLFAGCSKAMEEREREKRFPALHDLHVKAAKDR